MTTVERIAYWTEPVERWEIEGSSRKVFCEDHGIGYASFLAWCKLASVQFLVLFFHVRFSDRINLLLKR
jgi:hypothetical protein